LVNRNGTTLALEDITIRARGSLTEHHFVDGHFVKKGRLFLVIDEEPFSISPQSARARHSEDAAVFKRVEECKWHEASLAQVELDRAHLVLAQIPERRSRVMMNREPGSGEDFGRLSRRAKAAGQNF
jgi:multidrug resistance efflux pump